MTYTSDANARFYGISERCALMTRAEVRDEKDEHIRRAPLGPARECLRLSTRRHRREVELFIIDRWLLSRSLEYHSRKHRTRFSNPDSALSGRDASPLPVLC